MVVKSVYAKVCDLEQSWQTQMDSNALSKPCVTLIEQSDVMDCEMI